MTVEEEKNFYLSDTKEYEIANNKDFLSWLRNSIKDGYNFYDDLDTLQRLIDNIVSWYEFKCSNRSLSGEGSVDTWVLQDIEPLNNMMNIKQLLFSLPYNQLRIMECPYQGRAYTLSRDSNTKYDTYVSIGRKKVEKHTLPYFLLGANPITGEVVTDFEIKEFLADKKSISVEELLDIFQRKYSNQLDFSELKEMIYNHDCDVELRHRLLELASLKMLYSRNTVPHLGYERSQIFIKEFNEELGLTLTTAKIEEIMKRDYGLSKRK